MGFRRAAVAAGVVGLLLASATQAGVIGEVESARADETRIQRYWPLDLDVEPGDVEFKGSISFGSSPSNDANVVFAVDVSGSTTWPSGMDCNGDRDVNDQDNYNLDSNVGDVLDCEISAVTSLAAELRALENAGNRVNVGIVAFGSDAAIADMTYDGEAFVSPGFHNPDPDKKDEDELISAVNTVAASLKSGSVGKYTAKYVGGGTDFNRAVSASLDLLGSTSGNGWLFFLSDGEASVSDSVLQRLRDNSDKYKARTFAVGSGASPCAPGSPLYEIAHASGDSCVSVADPTQLTTGLVTSQPDFINKIHVEFKGVKYPATVDAIGNWVATVPDVKAGQHKATVRATYTNGWSSDEAVWNFTAKSNLRQISLGDSYSSGEGVEPYLQQDSPSREYNIDFLCHRSQNSWPSKVHMKSDTKQTTTELGGDFSFQACSGAVIKNLDSKRQEKTWHNTKVNVKNGLQLEHLTPDTDLVTLTIGGNDLGFVPLLDKCYFSWGCANNKFGIFDTTLDDWVRIRLALMHNELEGTYSAIRSKTSSRTDIVVATYPRLIEPKPVSCLVPISGGERAWMNGAINTFAEIVSRQALKSDLIVADVRGKFAGRAVCGKDPAIYPLNVGARGTDISGGALSLSASSVHPNSKGIALYAEAANEALANARSKTPRVAVLTMNDQPDDTVLSEDDAYFDDVVENPDEVLAQYSQDVIDAVQTTTFIEDFVVAKKHPDGWTGEQCDAVVADEIVPLKAQGFEADSEVVVTVGSTTAESEESVEIARLTVVTDEFGVLEHELTLPADLRGETLLIELSGVSEDGGFAYGNYLLEGTTDEDCVNQASAAGALSGPPSPSPSPTTTTGPEPTASPSPSAEPSASMTPSAKPSATATSSSSPDPTSSPSATRSETPSATKSPDATGSPSPSDLPGTGSGLSLGRTLAVALAGLCLIAAGTWMLLRRRRA